MHFFFQCFHLSLGGSKTLRCKNFGPSTTLSSLRYFYAFFETLVQIASQLAICLHTKYGFLLSPQMRNYKILKYNMQTHMGAFLTIICKKYLQTITPHYPRQSMGLSYTRNFPLSRKVLDIPPQPFKSTNHKNTYSVDPK